MRAGCGLLVSISSAVNPWSDNAVLRSASWSCVVRVVRVVRGLRVVRWCAYVVRAPRPASVLDGDARVEADVRQLLRGRLRSVGAPQRRLYDAGLDQFE